MSNVKIVRSYKVDKKIYERAQKKSALLQLDDGKKLSARIEEFLKSL